MNLVKVSQLYRPKISGWVAHNGLELIFDDGHRQVFHNSPVTGPTICSYEEFAENLPVTKKHDITTNLDDVMQRLSSLLRKNREYHVIHFNCEQAVSWVLAGVQKSPQVKAFISFGVLSGMLVGLCGGNAKQVASAAVLGGSTGLFYKKKQLLR